MNDYYDPYSTAQQRCNGGFIDNKCTNGEWYSSQTHICTEGQVMVLAQYYMQNGYEQCGTGWYNTSLQRCQGGVIQTKCGEFEWYSSYATHVCYNNTVITFIEYYGSLGYEQCGSSWYNPSSEVQRCRGGVLEGKCGEVGWYNGSTQTCVSNEYIYEYNYEKGSYDRVRNYAIKDRERCSNGTYVVENKCVSGRTYNPETQFCNGSDVVDKCNNTYYNPAIQFCYKNQTYNLCGGEPYDFETEYCSNGTKQYYSGTMTYGNKTYNTTVIDGKTWMAENLNYYTEGSKCYAEGVDGVSNDSIAKNCEMYGRLYDWATAMGFSSYQDCNTTDCSSMINTPNHQGICPYNWHLPTDAEWTALTTYVSTAGTALKASYGWSTNNGTDDYGFTGLPGGYRNQTETFSSIRSNGYWWSSSQYNTTNATQAYYRSMSSSTTLSRTYDPKTRLLSVRCVRDY
jgi:uncharacterized protein (TIGR02145 family)